MKGPDRTAMRWFRALGAIGLGLSVAGFALYAAGLLPTRMPPERSAELWSRPVGDFRETSGLSFGAGWMAADPDGYAIISAALAFLASTALPTLAALAVVWFRRKDRLYAFMALGIMAVLIAAIVR